MSERVANRVEELIDTLWSGDRRVTFYPGGIDDGTRYTGRVIAIRSREDEDGYYIDVAINGGHTARIIVDANA